MSLTFGLSPWWLLPTLLAAAGLTYWTYRRTQPPVSTARQLVLAGLRFCALGLIILLLLEPIARQFEEDRQPPLLGVLVDASESVTIRADTTVDAEQEIHALLNRIRESSVDGEKAFFTFGADARSVTADALDTVSFNGPRTNISRALDRVRQQYGDQNLKSVLLLSDGQYNSGRNPIYQAEEYPVPIHTVALGDTARPTDLQVRQVETNDIAYVDRELPVQVRLQHRGFGGQTVRVDVTHRGTQVATQRVDLTEESSEETIELFVTPEEAGLQQYTVSVSELEGEQTFENNQATAAVRVLERRRRILLMAGAPSPSLSAVYQTLSKDADNEIVRRTQMQTGSFYEGSLPSDLSSFDVIVLVGYPGPASESQQLQRIAEQAAEQPVLFVLDRQTDLQRLRDAFGDHLPVRPSTIRSGFKPVLWATAPRGQTHPILNISDGAEISWSNLPPLEYSQTSWEPAPDARVLATIREQGVTLDSPLLLIRQRSGHRSGALLGTGLHRWHNLPETDERMENVWPELLSNLVEWMTTREDDRPVRVQPTQTVFDSREAVQFTGEVYNESMNPVDNASVELTVTGPDGATYPYPMQSAGNGQYRVSIGTLPAGSYEYRAVARRDTEELGTDRGTFAVGSVGIEFLNTRANPTLLRQVARRSGGSVIHPDSLDQLPRYLQESEQFDEVVTRSEREARLWQWPYLLGLVIVLLTGEWILRKRSGLV